MALIAIEIEEAQAVVASARVSGKRIQIQHLFSFEVSGDDAEVAEKIQQALAKNGLSRSEAVVVVNRASVEMREMTVPPAPDSELPDMVRFIARSEFASFNESWVLDYVPLSDDSTESRTVLAAAISPELNGQIRSIADSSGVKVRSIVLRPYAVIDSIRDALKDRLCSLIVVPGRDRIDVLVVDGSKLIAARTVNAPSAVDANQRNDGLVSEIRRTLASSRDMLGGNEVSRVLLVGNDQENKDLKDNLSDKLGLDIAGISPLGQVATKSDMKRPDDEARYAALIGALVRQNSEEKHEFDFFNPRKPIKQKNDKSKLYLYSGLGAAACLLTILLGWWTLRSQKSTIAQLRLDLEAQIEENDGVNGSLNVDQVIGEVRQIDQWKLTDINWLEELYQYSKRSLTADDVIVDTFEAEINRRETDAPRILVNTRAATVINESELFDALKVRPFGVKPEGGRKDNRDTSYPHARTLRISLMEDPLQQLRQLDQDAGEFLKRQATLASDPPTSEVPPAGEEDVE